MQARVALARSSGQPARGAEDDAPACWPPLAARHAPEPILSSSALGKHAPIIGSDSNAAATAGETPQLRARRPSIWSKAFRHLLRRPAIVVDVGAVPLHRRAAIGRAMLTSYFCAPDFYLLGQPVGRPTLAKLAHAAGPGRASFVLICSQWLEISAVGEVREREKSFVRSARTRVAGRPAERRASAMATNELAGAHDS